MVRTWQKRSQLSPPNCGASTALGSLDPVTAVTEQRRHLWNFDAPDIWSFVGTTFLSSTLFKTRGVHTPLASGFVARQFGYLRRVNSHICPSK